MSQQILTDEEIDRLLANKDVLVPDEILPRVREACRDLKSLAKTLRKPAGK